jgi:hypothetical protein
MRRGLFIGTLLIVAAHPNAAVGQSVPLLSAESSALVRMLGDRAFAAREKAHIELVRRGESALPAVRFGAESDDPEIRRRCRDILAAHTVSEDEVVLAPFLAGKDSSESRLPGWGVVRGVVGDDDVGRRIYAVLYRGDRDLLMALANDPDAAGAEFRRRARSMTARQAVRRVNALTLGYTDRDLRTELAGLIVLACAGRNDYYPNSTATVLKVLQLPTARFCFGSGGEMGRLVEKWIDIYGGDVVRKSTLHQIACNFECADALKDKLRADGVRQIDEISHSYWVDTFRLAIDEAMYFDASLIERTLKPRFVKSLRANKILVRDERTVLSCLDLARSWKLTEGVDFAVRVAQNTEALSTLRCRALAALVDFGEPRAVAGIEKLLDDDATIIDRELSTDELAFQQLRDCVLVTLIQLSGQRLVDYPIDTIGPPQYGLPAIGFETNDSRLLAQHLWRESQSSNRK